LPLFELHPQNITLKAGLIQVRDGMPPVLELIQSGKLHRRPDCLSPGHNLQVIPGPANLNADRRTS
jgi:hypothetical protein